MCDICNKVFDTPSSMNRHQYSHKTLKHFCADCDKEFFFKVSLPHTDDVTQKYQGIHVLLKIVINLTNVNRN